MGLNDMMIRIKMLYRHKYYFYILQLIMRTDVAFESERRFIDSIIHITFSGKYVYMDMMRFAHI